MANERPRRRARRSETATIRMTPQLNSLCDEAAWLNHQTKSSFIEAAAEAAVEKILGVKLRGGEDET